MNSMIRFVAPCAALSVALCLPVNAQTLTFGLKGPSKYAVNVPSGYQSQPVKDGKVTARLRLALTYVDVPDGWKVPMGVAESFERRSLKEAWTLAQTDYQSQKEDEERLQQRAIPDPTAPTGAFAQQSLLFLHGDVQRNRTDMEQLSVADTKAIDSKNHPVDSLVGVRVLDDPRKENDAAATSAPITKSTAQAAFTTMLQERVLWRITPIQATRFGQKATFFRLQAIWVFEADIDPKSSNEFELVSLGAVPPPLSQMNASATQANAPSDTSATGISSLFGLASGAFFSPAAGRADSPVVAGPIFMNSGTQGFVGIHFEDIYSWRKLTGNSRLRSSIGLLAGQTQGASHDFVLAPTVSLKPGIRAFAGYAMRSSQGQLRQSVAFGIAVNVSASALGIGGAGEKGAANDAAKVTISAEKSTPVARPSSENGFAGIVLVGSKDTCTTFPFEPGDPNSKYRNSICIDGKGIGIGFLPSGILTVPTGASVRKLGDAKDTVPIDGKLKLVPGEVYRITLTAGQDVDGHAHE